MRHLVLLILFLGIGTLGFAQKPAYCDELPTSYDQVAARAVSQRPKLPAFKTQAVPEYKVQVAILKFTDPASYPFHATLVARHRPCEEVWVVESRETFQTRQDAEKLQQELRKLGYTSAYIVELIGYQ